MAKIPLPLQDDDEFDAKVLESLRRLSRRGELVVDHFSSSQLLVKLPKEEIALELDKNGRTVHASLYDNRGYRHFQMFPLSDLPNDLITADDLQRFGIDVPKLKSAGGT